MAVQTVSGFFFLIVISVTATFYLLTWENSKSISIWPAFSVKNGSRGEDGLFGHYIFWQEERNLTPPHALFISAHLPKINETTQSSSVTKPKRDQTMSSVPETPIPVLSRESFKKLPQWDFEDVYNQDASPRQTTCAQSLRNSKDEFLQKAFLPNIRLFLHKDNINMSEWNRLSHFNNPFGFMEFRYNDVMPSLKLIPKPKEPLLPPKGGDGCVRCAVVGAGGILNGSKMGAEIDAHDYVFRPRTYYSGQYNESRFYVLHQDFLRYVRNRFLKSQNLNATFWAIVRPTNGAFTLFLALHTCDTVSAYGFMTEDYNKYSNYYVQRFIKSNVIFYSNHDYIMEKDLWKNLHDRKIIKLYQGRGRNT
ncbi:alpha-N-acetylgalactosaminide alpha-2,6-sialyltransferase 1-like isoform 2-T2 [Odontesthes bonariensis]|uniref:alpha-N-acetylgalactosaminide alpha-2,6-sialyltransferase 1-like isoform X2 n=1 Tax=Odontesthes bonariensis TaxID=219752 RepID=UPI003F58F127